MDNARTIPEWLKNNLKPFAKKIPFYIQNVKVVICVHLIIFEGYKKTMVFQ